MLVTCYDLAVDVVPRPSIRFAGRLRASVVASLAVQQSRLSLFSSVVDS
jgi:hypothetical protein